MIMVRVRRPAERLVLELRVAEWHIRHSWVRVASDQCIGVINAVKVTNKVRVGLHSFCFTSVVIDIVQKRLHESCGDDVTDIVDVTRVQAFKPSLEIGLGLTLQLAWAG